MHDFQPSWAHPQTILLPTTPPATSSSFYCLPAWFNSNFMECHCSKTDQNQKHGKSAFYPTLEAVEPDLDKDNKESKKFIIDLKELTERIAKKLGPYQDSLSEYQDIDKKNLSGNERRKCPSRKMVGPQKRYKKAHSELPVGANTSRRNTIFPDPKNAQVFCSQ